jgi:acyl-[acyl-carrier-protein]-phospholipid O-acyltransferase/long-chain-fatty-acid--[acyl-carrier-protein] ligase
MKRWLKYLIKTLFKLIWRVEVQGLAHYYDVDQRRTPLLIVANHLSLLDGPLIDLFLPGQTTFMIDRAQTQSWWQKRILRFGDFIEVDLHNPLAAKHMIHALQAGKQGMIFPEGRISTTGGLMKIYEGTALVAVKSQAQILPVVIDGAQFTPFSYLDGRVRWQPRRWFTRIRLTILPAQTLTIDPQSKGHARHAQLKQALFKLMRDCQFYGRFQPTTLFQALLDAKQRYPQSRVSVSDALGRQLSLRQLVRAARVLGAHLAQRFDDETIGVLLPNISAMPVVFFALQTCAKRPALLNFSAGERALRSACETAQIRHILTSRQFIEKAGLNAIIDTLSQDVSVHYLEDLRAQIRPTDKLRALLTPLRRLAGLQIAPEQAACILFTSGSEGLPKAVVLSHSNLISNVQQISAMFTLLPNDNIVNALPTFHSFGLTAGLLWPILQGARVELYPSPLHYHLIPELIYQTNARLFFATDTFYSGYARKADAYDFYSIDALVAGAEKLKDQTRRLYADRFHTPIFEGYGVTETAPVLAVNIPQACLHGSVGQFVPGIEYRLEPVDGLEHGGRLWVKGPNIMLGYYLADAPGQLVAPPDGWHDTGDLVAVDEQGFVHILGRAKRFAKIAGEMVSLAAIEQALTPLCYPAHVVAVRRPDPHKGEHIILLSNAPQLTKQQVAHALRQAGFSELTLPKTLILVDHIPLLGTGKINYPEVENLVPEPA